MIGIYIITNEINNKVYIGQVGKGKNKTFTTRLNNHYNDLKNNKHNNKHLQSSWNKYGEENFTFDILEECTKEELNEKEKYWIAYYESDNPEFGYNKTKGGEGGIPNEEIKKKISDSLKGEKNPRYGTKHTEETKKKMRDKALGRKLSREIKNKISNTIKGSKLKEDTKQKISSSNKGRTFSEETKKKIGEANKISLKGRKLSLETKKKISETMKKKKLTGV